ncbi:hypothetical protein AWJ20_5048 [Sugiyamaella lignohabitans]|uniref:Transcription factor IIIC 90kDa subunit N-terminal domain-containing protein n=1 Tax=Sugiyamaella lignohabitans TaxID=796027 RepID=A0A167EHK0_9ASCO|nr:uncharacterized protein AWJ20_5048 [Sugiyamaella lignohabitans]ANB14091.1 hypothetical protein AWJ20_5048 [Sugiyamaella lignohabitans]
MPVTIKIDRSVVSSAADAISWSQDGRLAVASGQSITILSPTTNIPPEEDEEGKKRVLRYDTNHTVVLDEVPSYYSEITSSNDQAFSLTATTAEIVFVNADWSPSGMAAITRGCLLATLTSRGEVVLFHQQGNPHTVKWQLRANLNHITLQDLLRANRLEVHVESQKLVLDDNQMRGLRFHSLAWSERFIYQGGDKWGSAFLALGSELGYVMIYEINANEIKKAGEIHVGDEWITGLKWSSWSADNSSNGTQDVRRGRKTTDNETVNRMEDSNDITHAAFTAFLSVSTSTNRLVVKKIHCTKTPNGDAHVDSMDVDHDDERKKSTPRTPANLTVLEDREVLASSRFHLSIHRWYRDNIHHTNVLAVVRARHLDVFIFSENTTKSKILSFTTDFSAHPTVLMISRVNPTVVQVTTTSCKGESFSVNIDTVLEEALDVDDSRSVSDIISSLVSKRKKRTTDSLTTALVNFECFGGVVHPHGTYIALAYTLTPIEKLRYPILSQQSCRIVFLPLGNESLETLIVPTARSIIDGSSLSTWWEILTLQTFISKSDRENYMKKLIDQLQTDESSPESIYAGQTAAVDSSRGLVLENMLNRSLFKPSLERHRLLLHLGVGSATVVLQFLAAIVLRYANGIDDHDNLGLLDRVSLLSYNHVMDGDSTPLFNDGKPTEIAISGRFFEEVFDFQSENSGNLESITSKNGVAWRRCSVTLLPLTSKDVVTCEGCQRKRIKTVPKENWLVLAILRATDVCIYCGSHYHER